MNPINFISGLSTNIKAGMIAILVIGAFVGGWTVHGWKTDAGAARSIDHDLKTSQTLNTQAEKIIETKQAKEQEIKIVYRDIKREIREQADDRICFTHDSLQLWNAAITGTDSHRAEPPGETAENAAVVATVEEVLTNASENFETCNSNSVKHNALIDKLQTLKGKMCVCHE
ncbi:MAG TPA: hypothetical protein VIO56_06840 [Methylotenera sp.]